MIRQRIFRQSRNYTFSYTDGINFRQAPHTIPRSALPNTLPLHHIILHNDEPRREESSVLLKYDVHGEADRPLPHTPGTKIVVGCEHI